MQMECDLSGDPWPLSHLIVTCTFCSPHAFRLILPHLDCQGWIFAPPFTCGCLWIPNKVSPVRFMYPRRFMRSGGMEAPSRWTSQCCSRWKTHTPTWVWHKQSWYEQRLCISKQRTKVDKKKEEILLFNLRHLTEGSVKMAALRGACPYMEWLPAPHSHRDNNGGLK